MELVYSAQRSGFEKGRHYENPRYFDGRVKKGVTHVYVLGDWPKVEEAYDEAGVNVTKLKEGAPISWLDGNAPEEPGQELVEITKQWKKWGWPRLRDTAEKISGREVPNKKAAYVIIERELERRADLDNMPERDEDEETSPSADDDGDE